MRVISLAIVVLVIAGAGCAAPRAFVLSDPDKPLPGNFGDSPVGLQAADVNATIIAMPAGSSSPLGADVTSIIAETMNRGLDAQASSTGLSTTVTVRESALGSTQVFGVAVETKLPDGTVVATRSSDTDVASGMETPVVWGLIGVGFCCGAPIIISGALTSGGIIILPLLIAAIVMAIPALAATIALPFARSAFLDGRIRAASNLVVSAVQANAAAVRERLAGASGTAQRTPSASPHATGRPTATALQF
jgi:hypothetical protein